MRAEIDNLLQEINKSLDLISKRIDLENSKKKLEELDHLSQSPDLWKNKNKAQKLMKERGFLQRNLQEYLSLKNQYNDNYELLNLAEQENDQTIIDEVEVGLKLLKEKSNLLETVCLLDGEVDINDTFLEINAGAGGTESCDWASMLSRMYQRWSEKNNYKIEIISENPGDEAGIKSITFKVRGENAYGWLKSESGVHRLVRISPFDSSARRHTSFCSVWVYPVIDDEIDIEIKQSEIRVDTFRSSGAGGQHVNTTDSAVRITHLPSGIVVTSSEKSQHQNRANCMTALKSRLYELEMRKRNSAIQEAHDNKGDAGWGNQIRSYVLQPYQMVKDLRTNYETSNSQAVLDGELQNFMTTALAQRII